MFLLQKKTLQKECLFSISVVEMVGPKWRLHTGIMFGYFFSIGYMFLPLVAYFVRDWRKFQLVVGVPMAAFLLLWW